ncbi:hypothetical protein EVA_00324 [gut metagenome]|uniref:Uncharacterized protein n=1 Tax=gut metagenome TaxID=749906 RepID=J9H923_9ZZZZ
MNALLKHWIYMLFFFLLAFMVSEEPATVDPATAVPVSYTSHYEPQQDPYEKAMDFLFDHQFADVPQTALSVDNSQLMKFKCLVRVLASFQELRKQSQQPSRCNDHRFHSLYPESVDYYVYTLRHILI